MSIRQSTTSQSDCRSSRLSARPSSYAAIAPARSPAASRASAIRSSTTLTSRCQRTFPGSSAASARRSARLSSYIANAPAWLPAASRAAPTLLRLIPRLRREVGIGRVGSNQTPHDVQGLVECRPPHLPCRRLRAEDSPRSSRLPLRLSLPAIVAGIHRNQATVQRERLLIGGARRALVAQREGRARRRP